MDIFKKWRTKNSKKIYRCERKFIVDYPYSKKTDWRLMTEEEKMDHWRLSYDNRKNDLELEFKKSIIEIPNEIKEICYTLIEGEIFEIIMLDPDVIIKLAYKINKILKNKNMENKEKTPYDVMMENNRDVQAYCNLIGYMNEHNLIIDIEDQCKEKSTLKDLIFKEKENMRTEIKPNGEVHLHIHSFLKEVKEVHIPPVDSETDIKSQVIDIITKALQEAKIKTDGTK